eukprot:1821027-Amphidinium_carterae.3
MLPKQSLTEQTPRIGCIKGPDVPTLAGRLVIVITVQHLGHNGVALQHESVELSGMSLGDDKP